MKKLRDIKRFEMLFQAMGLEYSKKCEKEGSAIKLDGTSTAFSFDSKGRITGTVDMIQGIREAKRSAVRLGKRKSEDKISPDDAEWKDHKTEKDIEQEDLGW